jgi:hypothetical protein
MHAAAIPIGADVQISLSCFSEITSTYRRQSIGGAIF